MTLFRYWTSKENEYEHGYEFEHSSKVLPDWSGALNQAIEEEMEVLECKHIYNLDLYIRNTETNELRRWEVFIDMQPDITTEEIAIE